MSANETGAFGGIDMKRWTQITVPHREIRDVSLSVPFRNPVISSVFDLKKKIFKREKEIVKTARGEKKPCRY